jgi:peptidoglycan-associated lipoprotein
VLAVAACSQKHANSKYNSNSRGVSNGVGSTAYSKIGRGPISPGSQKEFSTRIGDTVYFSTDSSNLRATAQQTLAGQAGWLRQYSNYPVLIEGHADERGTREYNIALGAQRAAAVKRFLISQGVSPRRIRTISYGKERPVAVCSDISCWRQNRRAVTVLDNGGKVASY